MNSIWKQLLNSSVKYDFKELLLSEQKFEDSLYHRRKYNQEETQQKELL